MSNFYDKDIQDLNFLIQKLQAQIKNLSETVNNEIMNLKERIGRLEDQQPF